ncbi:hypothetical protein EJ03DRAFT_279303, partial [Teratosphaeria nubilosa]
YAYGKGGAMPLFYADGQAYLGWTPPAGAKEATNVTFVEDDNGDWIASPINTSFQTIWTTPRLFIDTTPGAFISAGFTEATNTSVTTTGFKMFGTLAMWKSNDGKLQSLWYAANTTQEGLYHLKWNVDNTIENDAQPVALKNAKYTHGMH